MNRSSCKTIIRCTRRIRDPLSYLTIQPTDADQVVTSIRTTDAAMVTWYVPLKNLQRTLHRRYEAEEFGELVFPDSNLSSPNSDPSLSGDKTKSGDSSKRVEPLGLVTLIVGNNIPTHQGLFEKWFDPAPHPTISLRVMVMDRIHWQRTAWMAGTICPSLCWGKIPQRIYSINLDFSSKIYISGGRTSDDTNTHRREALAFDDSVAKYTSLYDVEVPNLGFRLTLKDTGKRLLDKDSRIVDGFLDNESALHRLSLAREVNMGGLGGSVYRQTFWSTPSLPNNADVVQFEPGELFNRYFGCSPIGKPIASWLLREVEKTLIYQMEGEVEDENDPNSATTYGDRSLTERVQKKAMNRYNGFRDELRGKIYSEMEGREIPR